MTDEIKKIIDSTKAAVAGNTGGRAVYSLELKKAILSVADEIGIPVFERESGLPRGSISKWRKRNALKNLKTGKSDSKRLNKLPQKVRQQKPSLGIREIEVTPSLELTRRVGMARIKAGEQIEIEVPLDFLTPDWVSSLIGVLSARKRDVVCSV